ncbi:Type IV fimbriae expression regulatory protein PilR [Olavius algarvensis Delta 1 endosymbiont]|nr:Type IV fimbriae expression regulatory protein PilR [Olavius algarvensis Delta 1 endosymbiont]
MEDTKPQKRLLVIDDEANMRHMLATVLKKADYVVDAASDGAEGLQLIERNSYDFILCDIKMPKMGGMEFLEASRDKLNGTTIIMMSAYGSIDTAIGAMKLGAYDYRACA